MATNKKRNNSLRLILLIVSILSYIWYLYYHSRINPDEAYSLAQAESFLQGKGLTIQSAKPQDLANIIISYNPRFPPGYALAIAALLKVTLSPGSIDFILEVIAALVFFLCWFWILKAHSEVINFTGEAVLWVLWIFFPAPLMAGILTAHTTETISVALFMASLLFGSFLITTTNRTKVLLLGSVIGLISGLAAFLRYMYWPLLAILPATIFFWSLAKKKLRIYLGSIFSILFINCLFLAGMMIPNHRATGHYFGYQVDLFGEVETRLDNSQDEIHWDHLTYTIPFPLFTLGISDPSYMSTRTIIETPPTLPAKTWMSWGLSGMIVAGFIIYAFKMIKPMFTSYQIGDNPPKIDQIQFIALAGIFTFTLTITTLVYLSITSNLAEFGGGWVPVMELRYYSPVFIFFTLGLGYLVSQTTSQQKYLQYFAYSMGVIIIGTLLIESVWRFQITSLQIREPNSYFSSSERFERETRLIDLLLPEIDPSYPVIVVYSEHDTTIRRMGLNKGFVVAPLETVPPTPALYASTPVNILAIYRNSEPEDVKSYFTKMIQDQDGTCVNRGLFTGCHFLFTP